MSLDALPLHTRSLLIRRFIPEDAREIFALSNEEVFRAELPSQVYADEAEARSVLEYLIGRYSDPGDPRRGPYVLAIEHEADRVLIGHVGLSPFDGDVEIGYAIAHRYQRRGLATEAIVSACGWAFDTFKIGRILGITSAVNVASQRALLHAGFVHDGDRVMNFQGTEQPVKVYAAPARPAG